MTEGLKIFLQNRLKRLEADCCEILKKYGVKNIFEMDDKIKNGNLSEDCLEDFQSLDGLEHDRNQIQKDFSNMQEVGYQHKAETYWLKAAQIVSQNNELDIGDVYQSLHCLDLSPMERLTRGLMHDPKEAINRPRVGAYQSPD